jgi:hypothetical protein
MYTLWVSNGHYIEGTKLGRGSKAIKTLKARAIKHFNFKIVFTDELEGDSACIWIDAKEGATPVGLIKGP